MTITPAENAGYPLHWVMGSEHALHTLGLLSGRITSLAGVELFPSLRSLRLQNLPKVSSIADILALRKLETLQILYCKHIRDAARVKELPALRKLSIFGCGDLGVEDFER